MKNKKRLVRITTIYNVVLFCIEYCRSSHVIFTSKGIFPFDDILYIDFIGVVV